MFFDYVKCIPQYLIPHHLLTRLMGYLAEIKIPFLKNFAIRFFIWKYDVDMHSALEKDPLSYPTFNAFFIRALKPNVRPIYPEKHAIVSPADGTISQIGLMDGVRLFQAKKHYFNLHELLGGNTDRSDIFLNGHYATFYLSPRDYHRVHMPLTGTLKEMIYIPGKLFSVNNRATKGIPQLFSRNERVICLFETSAGPMAVILIGAMIVGSISTRWAGVVTPEHQKEIQQWQYTNSSVVLQTGDELGYFKLGSSVIILFSENKVSWNQQWTAKHPIKMGELIGRVRTVNKRQLKC